jgi:hypothetical protein
MAGGGRQAGRFLNKITELKTADAALGELAELHAQKGRGFEDKGKARALVAHLHTLGVEGLPEASTFELTGGSLAQVLQARKGVRTELKNTNQAYQSIGGPAAAASDIEASGTGTEGAIKD